MKQINYKFIYYVLFILAQVVFIAPSYATDVNSNKNSVEVSIYGEQGRFKPQTRSYLGTQIGAGPNIFNFVKTDNNMSYKAKGIDLSYPLSHNINIFAGYKSGSANQNQTFDTIDANGDNLLIPGVGVGPVGEGFFLPAADNQITNGYYYATHKQNSFNLGLTSNYNFFKSNFTLSPTFMLEYKTARTDETFAGSIPFFIRDFAYRTKTNVRSISPFLGLNINYDFNSIVSIYGGGQIGLNFNRGTGSDTLAFTGFDDQLAKMKNNRMTNSHMLKTGILINATDRLSLSLEAQYQNIGNVPSVNLRDGTNVSNFDYKNTQIYFGGIRATYKF